MAVFSHDEAKLIQYCPMTMGKDCPERCVGKICSAWRWFDSNWTMDGDDKKSRRGYCGLAGEVKQL